MLGIQGLYIHQHTPPQRLCYNHPSSATVAITYIAESKFLYVKEGILNKRQAIDARRKSPAKQDPRRENGPLHLLRARSFNTRISPSVRKWYTFRLSGAFKLEACAVTLYGLNQMYAAMGPSCVASGSIDNVQNHANPRKRIFVQHADTNIVGKETAKERWERGCFLFIGAQSVVREVKTPCQFWVSFKRKEFNGQEF